MHEARPSAFLPITLGRAIAATAARCPSRTALSADDGRQLAYGALAGRIARVANAVTHDLGLGPGDHAAIMAPTCLEYVELVCGFAEAGVPVAVINPHLTESEMSYLLADSEARALVVHPTLTEVANAADVDSVERVIDLGDPYEQWLSDARETRPDHHIDEWEPFALVYTSGTTGRPKGALLPHRSRVLAALAMAGEYGSYGPTHNSLAVAPLYHGGGFLFAVAPLVFGGATHILSGFEPELVMRALHDQQSHACFMVPTHFNALLALSRQEIKGRRLTALRALICNAAPLPTETKIRILDAFGPGLLHETYGSTEANIVSNLRPEDQEEKWACAGLPFPCTEVRITEADGADVRPGDIGELFSRSPYLFNGYWNQDATTTAGVFRDGWFSAGDLAWQDEDGYIYIVDRKTDMIITGGVNVYPREVEEALQLHPGVQEAAVVGLPDDYWGEAVTAFVVLTDEGRQLQDAELKAHCKQALASFKLPKRYVIVDELPRNPSGKVLRRELRDSSNRAAPGSATNG